MKLRSLSIVGVVVVAVLGAALNSRAELDVKKDPEEARHNLRRQAFKTDLSDFDFSADHETTLRAAVLTNICYPRPTVLLQPCGTECAIIAWKQHGLEEEEEGYQSLPPIEQVLATNQANLDSACTAALAGPIHFPLTAKHGS